MQKTQSKLYLLKMKKFDLHSIEKKEPFQAPDVYFDDLPLRMQKKLEADKDEKFAWLKIKLSPGWALTALAAVVLLAIGINFWITLNGTNDQLDPLDAIATADLVYYLESEAIPSDDLIGIFEQVNIEDSIWHDSELNLIPEAEMSDEELLFLYDNVSAKDEIL